MSTHLIERYSNDLQGVLSCYDRVVITGTLPGVCYARGMTSYLYANQIKVDSLKTSAQLFIWA